MESMPRTARDRFWDLICAFSHAVFALFAAGVLLLFLTLLSVANLDLLSQATGIVARFNLVLSITLLVSSGYVLYRCRD